jgi:hypothetical protein
MPDDLDPEVFITEDPGAVFWDQAPADIQRELDRVFGLIRSDPWIDGKVKHVFNYPPIVGVLYDHHDFQILYHHLNNGTIVILAVWPPHTYLPMPPPLTKPMPADYFFAQRLPPPK